ncbi:GIY-YIG nuclease family protein [candidate division KSB1 bacterium]|nr:GIY-YIG nuclease family protein [candidate division KSB1 bacterium]
MKYSLYIIHSDRLNSYYVGISQNVNSRIESHNSSAKGWTRRGRPWQIAFTKEFENRQEAHKWEQWIKAQKSKKLIEKIITGQFYWAHED